MIRKSLIIAMLFVWALSLPLPATSKDKDKKLTEIINNTVAVYGGVATLVVLRQSGQLRGLVKLYTGSDKPRKAKLRFGSHANLRWPKT